MFRGFLFWVLSPKSFALRRDDDGYDMALETMENNKLKRGLSTRHIRFMALGSAIGTGLF